MRCLLTLCILAVGCSAPPSDQPITVLEAPLPAHDARLDTYARAAHMVWEHWGASGFPLAVVFTQSDPACPGGGFYPNADGKCTTGVYHRGGWYMELIARDLPSQSSLAHELYHAFLDRRGKFVSNSGDWDHRSPGWFVICTPDGSECVPGSGPNDGVAGANAMLRAAGL